MTNKKKEEKEIIEKYEKIGNFTFKLDKYVGRVIFAIIIIILIVFYSLLIIYSEEKQHGPISEEIMLLINLYFSILAYIFLILIFISYLLLFVARLYKKRTKYDMEKVIKLYFYELTKNPKKDRLDEIVKHLSYNIWRLRDDYKGYYQFYRPYNWKIYYKIQRNSQKFKINTIDRILSFLQDVIICLEKYPSSLLKKIGNSFEDRNFRRIAKILSENKDICDELNKIKNVDSKKDRHLKPYDRLEGMFKLTYIIVSTILVIITIFR